MQSGRYPSTSNQLTQMLKDAQLKMAAIDLEVNTLAELKDFIAQPIYKYQPNADESKTYLVELKRLLNANPLLLMDMIENNYSFCDCVEKFPIEERESFAWKLIASDINHFSKIFCCTTFDLKRIKEQIPEHAERYTAWVYSQPHFGERLVNNSNVSSNAIFVSASGAFSFLLQWAKPTANTAHNLRNNSESLAKQPAVSYKTFR